MHVSAAGPEEMGDEDTSDSQWQNKTTMAEMGMPLETNVKVNENVTQNQAVRPAEGGYSTQDYRSESMTFEIIPGATPAGSEADCHPNGLDDCQRPAAGQPARKIVQIDSDGSDKDTESEMINISELSTLNANAVPWIPAGKGQAMQSPTDCEVDKDKGPKVEEVDKRHRGAQEGCTKKLRQEVSMLTGIPFPAGHFQHLEHLVAAIRLMRRKLVVVVCTENQCSVAGFCSPITTTTGTVREVEECNGQASDNKLYWHTPTSTVEVVALQGGGAQRGEQHR